MSDNLEITEEDQLLVLLTHMFEGEQVFMRVDDLKEIQTLLQMNPAAGKYITVIQEQLNSYYNALKKYEEFDEFEESP